MKTLLEQVQAQEVRYAKVVGWTLAQTRTDKDMTQKELAAKLGSPQSIISRIEAGKIPLSVERLAQWAAALDTSSRLLVSKAEDSVHDLKNKGYLVTYNKEGA